MKLKRLNYILLIFGLLIVQTSIAQKERLGEKDISIQKVFIEANKQKLLGNYEDAVFLFSEVLRKDKKNHAALYELARLQVALEDYDKARKRIEEALAIDEQNLWYNTFYAELLTEQEVFDEAAKVYGSLVKYYPEADEFYYQQAYMLFRSNKPEQAIKVYNALEDRLGVNIETTKRKYQIHMSLNKPGKAEAELKRFLQTYPKDLDAMRRLADHYDDVGENDKATALYEEILRINPEDVAANVAMAEAFKTQGEHLKYFKAVSHIFESSKVNIDLKIREILPYIDVVAETKDKTLREAATDLTQLLTEAHPDDAKAFSIHGDMLYYARQSEKAAEQYRRAIEINSGVFSVWQQLLIINVELNQTDALLKNSEEALDLFPNQPLLYFFNGLANVQKGNHDAAIGVFEQALMMLSDDNPLKEEIYVQLGSQYYETKKHAKSDEAFEAALKLNKDNALTLNNYSYFLSERGEQLEKAATMAERANQLSPNQASFMDTYGWVMYKQKRYREAKTWIYKALQNGGDNSPEILENYGDVLYQLQQVDEAVEYWQKALDNGSNSELLQKKITDRKLYE